MQKKADFVQMDATVFEKIDTTKVYWICNSGFLINSRGTCIFIDPVLEGFDLPLLTPIPLNLEDITHVDATLITHCDQDHFSHITNQKLKDKCDEFHATQYVASLFEDIGMVAQGHDIHSSFQIGTVKITVTPADHAWQNDSPKYASKRKYEIEDCCGFLIETEDGTIWLPSDSRLMQEQLQYDQPDVILLDISDSRWHLGWKNIPAFTDAYPEATLLPIHWGCIESTMVEFNGDPFVLDQYIKDTSRLSIIALGEAFSVHKK